MCILFMHEGANDPESDYSLILASNRDEFYDRPSKNMGPWNEDPNVFGGRDLEASGGGTWLALSPLRKKIGTLLNLPRVNDPNAKTRGKIVADFVKSETSASEYVEAMRNYARECNEFVFVTVELGSVPQIQTYTNATDKINTWTEPYLGFSNSLPEEPLKKVQAGKKLLKDICSRYKKVNAKTQLIEELVHFLKSTEQHLPDHELEKRRPDTYKHFSSIFVCIPEGRYGTRTHTIILVTKTGHLDMVELTLQPPVDLANPKWERTEFQFELPNVDNEGLTCKDIIL